MINQPRELDLTLPTEILSTYVGATAGLLKTKEKSNLILIVSLEISHSTM